MTRSNLTSNSASESGGACAVTLGSVHSDGNAYVGNVAASLGGVAYLLSSQGAFARDTFGHNAAGTDGGALALGGSQGTIDACTFGGNAAAGAGGGVALLSQSLGNVDLLGLGASTFDSNRAVRGGALSVDAAQLNAAGSVVERNTATADGGGLYAKGALSLQLDGVALRDNEANQGGGAFVREGAAPVLTRLQVVRNRAAVSLGGASALGGGLALVSAHGASLTHSVIKHNVVNETSASLALAQSDDDDTVREVLAGGLYCKDSFDMRLDNVSFASNAVFGSDASRGRGAGIAAFSCSAGIERVAFRENSADEAGGVLWRGIYPLVLQDCAFLANRAQRNPSSAAIQWGSESSGGEATGGGLQLEGCTHFADDLYFSAPGDAEELYYEAPGFEGSCAASAPASRRRALAVGIASEEAAEEASGRGRRRGRRLSSLSNFGVSTPISRLAWEAG